MKKILTLIVMAVAIAMSSNAQVMFGLKGGLNLTNISDFSFSAAGVDNAVKNKAGFFIGPTVKFTLPVVGLGIDASALYDQREGKVEGDGGEDMTLKSQSIQIPINVRFGFGLGETASIFIFAGPQFGFNIGDKNKTWTDYKNNACEWTLKSSTFSANVGLGVMLLKHLQFTANYNIAFGKTGEVDVKSAAESTWKTVTGAKANAWQIALAYYF